MKKKHENYLTIGKLSKLTDVNIKSLRYYDEIGILPPAYIDPNTGYRYYTPAQIRIVDAIQFCVELDIPLKNFQTYISDKNDAIRYGDLAEYGTKLANTKIQMIQQRLKNLSDMQKEIEQAELFNTYTGLWKYEMPKRWFWVLPYDKSLTAPAFSSALEILFEKSKEAGGKAGYDIGLLCLFKKQKCTQFLYVDALDKGNIPSKNLLYVPSGTFLCQKTDSDHMQNIPLLYPDLFEKDFDKLVILSELFTRDYSLEKPIYFIQCSTHFSPIFSA